MNVKKHHQELHSAWTKLKRGHSHRSRLNMLIERYSKSQLRFVKSFIRDGIGEKVYQLDSFLDQPPTLALPIIGDALFNYRATLDHMMWALVKISGNEPDGRTQFPIYNNQNEFNSNRCRTILSRVHPLIGQIIELYQPFHKEPYGYEGEILWDLRQLNNIDKHRHIHIVTGYYEGTFNQNMDDVEAWKDIQDSLFNNTGHVKAGTILAVIPSNYAQIEFVPSFEFAFDEHNEFAAGNLIRGTIGTIGNIVEAILDQFERLFFFKDSSALGKIWHGFYNDPYFKN